MRTTQRGNDGAGLSIGGRAEGRGPGWAELLGGGVVKTNGTSVAHCGSSAGSKSGGVGRHCPDAVLARDSPTLLAPSSSRRMISASEIALPKANARSRAGPAGSVARATASVASSAVELSGNRCVSMVCAAKVADAQVDMPGQRRQVERGREPQIDRLQADQAGEGGQVAHPGASGIERYRPRQLRQGRDVSDWRTMQADRANATHHQGRHPRGQDGVIRAISQRGSQNTSPRLECQAADQGLSVVGQRNRAGELACRG